MNSLPPIPAGVVTLDDHETHARTTLDANAWTYFAGGAADEHTVRANADAWHDLQLLPRVLRPPPSELMALVPHQGWYCLLCRKRKCQKMM